MKTTNNQKREPYMGKIAWSRCDSSRGHRLFGTDVKPLTTICLRINTAVQERNLSNTYIFSDKKIIEIEMSPLQWAEFLTAGNTDGVPCTLKYAEGKRLPEVPNDTQIQHFEDEVQNGFEQFENNLKNIETVLQEFLKEGKPVGKKQLQELLKQVEIYKTNTTSNLKFIQEQFQDTLGKMVVEAKTEVNAFVETKIMETGLNKLKEFEGLNNVEPLKIEEYNNNENQ